MKKSKLLLLVLGIILLTLVVAVPVIARAKNQTEIQTPEAQVSLAWAAYDADHLAFDLIIKGDFSVSEEYLPIHCPVSKVQVFDAAGNILAGTTTKSCRPLGDDTYALTQFLYSDFRENTPVQIEVYVGDIVLSPVGYGEVGHLPLIDVYNFEGPFDHSMQISAFPEGRVENDSLSLVVERVDFTPSLVKVDACINLPDAGDWIPSASLIMGDEQVQIDEWFIPNFREDPQIFERSERCYTFLAHQGVKDFRELGEGDISFVLDEVAMNIAESIDSEDLEKIKPELEKYNLPVEIDDSGSFPLSFIYGRGAVVATLDETEQAQLVNFIRETLSDVRSGPLVIDIR